MQPDPFTRRLTPVIGGVQIARESFDVVTDTGQTLRVRQRDTFVRYRDEMCDSDLTPTRKKGCRAEQAEAEKVDVNGDGKHDPIYVINCTAWARVGHLK